MEFEAFPKLPRLNRGMVISEKLDGTNACVVGVELDGHDSGDAIAVIDGLALYAQSRKRLITPEKDNYGFARWSIAAPGYMNPEGVVVYLSAARSMFKVTLKDDELPKSLAEAA